MKRSVSKWVQCIFCALKFDWHWQKGHGMHIAHVALHILLDVWPEVVNLLHFLCSALCAKMIRNSQGFEMPQLLGVQLKKLLKVLLFRKLWISVLWNWACKMSGPSPWRSLRSRHFHSCRLVLVEHHWHTQMLVQSHAPWGQRCWAPNVTWCTGTL